MIDVAADPAPNRGLEPTPVDWRDTTASISPLQRHQGLAAPAWFRRGMLLFSAWVIAGAYSDTWAHHHFQLTSVITPFHAVVFGGLFCEGLFVACALRHFGARPGAVRQAVPAGYGLAVAGCALALVGAPLDLAWHFFFGIDQGFGSVTSPTHVLIGSSTGLMATGPLREAWRASTSKASWAALLSATLVFAMIFFFDEATHPFLAPWAASYYPRMMLPENAEQVGTIEIVLWAALITGAILPLLLRFDLPFGAFTLVLGITGVLTTLIVAPQPVIIVGPIGGLVADEFYRVLRPQPHRRIQVRVIAVAVPLSMSALYFLVLGAAGGVWWPVNLWAGCITASGMTGLLVSLLVLPGAGPQVGGGRPVRVVSAKSYSNSRYAGKPL